MVKAVSAVHGPEILTVSFDCNKTLLGKTVFDLYLRHDCFQDRVQSPCRHPFVLSVLQLFHFKSDRAGYDNPAPA